MKKADKIKIGLLIAILIASLGIYILIYNFDETKEIKIEKPIEQINENKQTINQEVTIEIPEYKQDKNYNIKIIKIENKNNRNKRNNKNKNEKQ